MMKTTTSNSLHRSAIALAFLASASVTFAQINEELTGDAATAQTPPPAEGPEVGSAISGSLSLDVNTHFISYGADVWAEGGQWDHVLFNPSLSFTMDFGSGFYGFAGMWWDINDIGISGIGDNIQEIDLWAGLGYTYEGFTIEATYQEWIYAQDAERILDIMLSYDMILNPTLVIHNRVEGNGNQKTGTVFVLGASEGVTWERLNLDFGVDVAFNTDDFHGGGGGLTYVAAGPQLSYPLFFISEAFGEWNVHGGVTFYYTPSHTVPNNPTETFLTGNIGVGVDF